MTEIVLARNINTSLGGPFVAPWEVGELPNDWIDMVISLGGKLPRYQETRRKVENIFDKWRAEHRKKNG